MQLAGLPLYTMCVDWRVCQLCRQHHARGCHSYTSDSQLETPAVQAAACDLNEDACLYLRVLTVLRHTAL